MKLRSILNELFQSTGLQKKSYCYRKQFHLLSLLCRTSGGVKRNGLSITAPTVMWVKALDLLMDQLKITGLDFQDIRAVSGAGQVSHKLF